MDQVSQLIFNTMQQCSTLRPIYSLALCKHILTLHIIYTHTMLLFGFGTLFHSSIRMLVEWMHIDSNDLWLTELVHIWNCFRCRWIGPTSRMLFTEHTIRIYIYTNDMWSLKWGETSSATIYNWGLSCIAQPHQAAIRVELVDMCGVWRVVLCYAITMSYALYWNHPNSGTF